MDSASFQFVLFGLVVAAFSNFSQSRVWRSAVLFVASMVFLLLLAHDPRVLTALAGFLALGYICLLLLQRGWSRLFVWIMVAVVLVYAWLKRYTFLPNGILPHGSFFLLGLSYILFRVLHLLVDSKDRGSRAPIGVGAYLLYMLNFNTFLSGPIQFYDDFARDQFALQPIPLGARVVGLQIERIIRGFFKVNVLATLLFAAQEDALQKIFQPLPLSLRLFAAFRLTVAYPFFLYANFSGYIDIVIASSRLMRVRLPENFDRPFSATSFLDFWNRWHMSLSNWVKTYVYNPLLMALMRHISSVALQPFLGVFCFFAAFFLVGIWHGRTSEFIFLGLLFGIGVSVNKLWQVTMARVLGRKGYRALAGNFLYSSSSRGLTFAWFALANFWFWADWRQIGSIFTALAPVQWLGVWVAIWLCATVILALWEWLRAALLAVKTSEGPVLVSRYARVVYASALGLAAVVMTILLNQPVPEVIYKKF